MKKIFLLLIIVLPVYLGIALYSLDKSYFLCPVSYNGSMVIRCDAGGEGFFASPRNGRRQHEGIDLFASTGTPVLAVRSGKVIAAKKNTAIGMGNYIKINHSGGISTLYGHLFDIYVVDNEYVRQGQVIASVGKTGNANSRNIQPHLHFEIRKNGRPQDPMEYLE